MLLSSCAPYPSEMSQYQPYDGPVAASQVVYRIDENRFFENVPYEAMACARSWLYYTDTSKGIHTKIVSVNNLMGAEKFIIDAENDQYLVAPLINSNASCGASTSEDSACSPRLPYSTDAGRTWKFVNPLWSRSGDPVILVNDRVFYADSTAKFSDFVKGDDAWKEMEEKNFPKPSKYPIDTKFHCIRNGKE